VAMVHGPGDSLRERDSLETLFLETRAHRDMSNRSRDEVAAIAVLCSGGVRWPSGGASGYLFFIMLCYVIGSGCVWEDKDANNCGRGRMYGAEF